MTPQTIQQQFAEVYGDDYAHDPSENGTAIVFLVANLPKPPLVKQGDRAFVSDGSQGTATFGYIVKGGGSLGQPVYFDGTYWKVG